MGRIVGWGRKRWAGRATGALAGILLGAGLSSVPNGLEAQGIDSPYRYVETRNSVGIFGGYMEIDEGSLGLAPEPGPYFGARYDRRLTGPLSGEAAFGLIPSKRTVFVRDLPTSDLREIGEANLVILTGEVGFRFHLTGQRTWNGVAPYVTAALGFVADLSGSDAFETALPQDQLFRFGPGIAVAAGLGSDFFLTEQISLRADVRNFVWRLSYPGGISTTGQREEEWRQLNVGFSLGASYHF